MITIKCKSRVAEQMLANELAKHKNIEVVVEDAGEFVAEAAAHDAAAAEIKDMIKKGVNYDRTIRDLAHKVGKSTSTGEYESVVDHAKALSDVAKEAHKNAKGLHDAGWAFPHWKKLPAPRLSEAAAGYVIAQKVGTNGALKRVKDFTTTDAAYKSPAYDKTKHVVVPKSHQALIGNGYYDEQGNKIKGTHNETPGSA